MSETANSHRVFDALVLGGGFGGIQMLHKLQELGIEAIALEAGDDVGGAWYWNRYPGARCDVESLVYCYSFSPVIDEEWKWSERYSAQPEICAYLRFVVDRLDLRKHIRFNSRLTKAHFDTSDNLWHFVTEGGDRYTARYFISSAGPISAPIWPDIPDRETFGGELLHSALWPRDKEPDFSGKRVGVIGNGSSGTQLIPLVAKQAEQLSVFIRTPNFYMPACNRPLTESDYALWEEIRDDIRSRMRKFDIVGSGDIFLEEELHELRRRPSTDFTPEQRRVILERRLVYGGANVPRAFSDIVTNEDVNAEVSAFLCEQISKAIKDEETARILTPCDLAYGTKRVTVGTGYLETYNSDNVEAIDVKATPIERFTEKGVIVGGEELQFDTIICASGFDALTGALTVLDIRGEHGQAIKDVWSDNCDTYLGIGLAGFPNLLMIGGPGSPSVLVNVVMANDYQVEWIGNLLAHLRANGLDRIDVVPDAQSKWAQTVKDAIKGTVMVKSKSWYVGANVPGKTQGILAYAGGIANYIAACDEVAENGYKGFNLSRST
jgi:cyclohexanone monooxygenase